ncbi:MAG: hypothetical protein GX159_09980 [Flavobacteriaceae bacterium]|nr:hypothetical protein [Flavobacteriaceae bacterium]
MIFFGTVSNGLSSKLAGGNFWEGAAIGLTVSGLNHTMHKISFNRFVKKWTYRVQEELDAAGYDPDGIPQATTSYGNTMISKLRTLQIMNRSAKGKIRVTDIKNDPKIRGEANSEVGLRLSNAKGSWTFKSNTTYALVLIHEGAHIMFDVLGTYFQTGDHEHYQIFRVWLLPMINLNTSAYGLYDEFKTYAEKTHQSSKL